MADQDPADVGAADVGAADVGAADGGAADGGAADGGAADGGAAGSPGPLASAGVLARLADGTLAGSWALDASKSEILLNTRHTWGLRPLHGAFREVSGSATVTAAGEVSGVIKVSAGSIDTKNPTRDKHLRSADFFDVDNHPDITFTGQDVVPVGDGVRVTGSLTVRDRTLPVSFDAKILAVGDALRLDGELAINRGDYGLTWNMLGIAAMQNTIVVHATFTRQ
jgi:polyisoprenoid-binding protein YceI